MPGEPLGTTQSPDVRTPAGLSAEDFTSAVTAITSAFGDPSRRSIYLFARGSEDGVTASEVAEHFDLHANVARHHLDKLAAGGYLEVRLGRTSGLAGRPSKRYVKTGDDVVLELPVRRDDLMGTLLARALELLPADVAEAMAEQVGIEYGRVMASSLAPGGDGHRSFRSALHAVADALTAHGFAAHTEGRGNALRIVSDHCPFGATAVDSPVICAVDRGMVKGMLGVLYGETSPALESSLPMGDRHCVTAVEAS